MGKDVVEAFGLAGFENGKNPVALALEWGVRRLGEKLELPLARRPGQARHGGHLPGVRRRRRPARRAVAPLACTRSASTSAGATSTPTATSTRPST